MKRKMKKFNEGGETKYNREDEGFFGNKINYREDSEGRKFVAGRPNPMDRNPQEQRYYSKDDVKKGLSDVGDKISNFFGGKKEEAKYDDSKSVGDANKSSSYNKSEEASRKSEPEEPAKGKTFLREEADIDYKSPKKKTAPAPRKVASDDKKSLGDKATRLPGKADDKDKKVIPLPGKDTKATRMPIGYDKLDLSDKEEAPKKGFSTKMGKTDEEREAQAKANRKALSESVSGISKYFRNPFTEEREEKKKSFERKLNAKPTADQMKKMAKGGAVKSASSRADGCAIRGKTRA
jgi:hypothetical protein